MLFIVLYAARNVQKPIYYYFVIVIIVELVLEDIKMLKL